MGEEQRYRVERSAVGRVEHSETQHIHVIKVA